MKKYVAETLSTFALVFFGTGAIVINQEFDGIITHTGIAFAFGIIVMIMIYAMGDISGAHMNPAVTLSFALAKKFRPGLVLPYFISQLAGALAASAALSLLFPSDSTLGATIPSGAANQSFVIEIILSFFLMLVILNVSSGSKEKGLMAGIAIGSTVLIEALVAGPVSGASMNPARSLAPALISGHYDNLWVYIFAPFLGTTAAIPVHHLLFTKNTDPNANSSIQ